LADYFSQNGIDLFQKFPNTTRDSDDKISPVTLASVNDLILIKECKTIYVKFLLTHPLYLVGAPLNQVHSLISPVSTEYEYRYEPRPTYPWVVVLTNIIFPQTDWVLLIGIVVILIGLLFARSESRPFLWFLLILDLSVIPLAILIWQADSMEIERHAEQLMIQSRLGFWLPLVYVIDCILGKYSPKEE
jgi:uncharacterized membrane protein